MKRKMGNLGVQEMDAGVVGVELTRSWASLQWGGTISALLLLLLNRIGPRSHIQTNLLVIYLFISFPTALFKILRGQFGRWVALLAVALHLFLPKTFPDWVADGVRDNIVGDILCLIIGVLLCIAKICEIGGLWNFECSFNCSAYFLVISLLFLFTILYL
ncbi:hypothetical protein SLEP1_g8073 [Rubroshorea leprosula]|uniref:Cold acclimation protein n=1 Tax=Rubroshorea leprosula TaxID=152421 RepID=A0AAV5I8F9_9ROSI|nr:hypothetical protein SLEP1_g8073 [Rubroshorea leprosula]